MSLSSELYKLGRKTSKAGSVVNDVKNIAKGHPERVVKKAVKREIFKSLNKIMRF